VLVAFLSADSYNYFKLLGHQLGYLTCHTQLLFINWYNPIVPPNLAIRLSNLSPGYYAISNVLALTTAASLRAAPCGWTEMWQCVLPSMFQSSLSYITGVIYGITEYLQKQKFVCPWIQFNFNVEWQIDEKIYYISRKNVPIKYS
jgi:hypothetical protein